MPTGVAFRDVRGQLLDAAERVLLRDGPSALTSRAVTTEADCAKGVLHRHFADFDAFLAELVLERVARVEDRAAALRASAGTGAVAQNLTRELLEVLDPVAVAVVGLVTSRDGLRARLREAGSTGLPILTDAAPRWPATSPPSANWAASARTPTSPRWLPSSSEPPICCAPTGREPRRSPRTSAGPSPRSSPVPSRDRRAEHPAAAAIRRRGHRRAPQDRSRPARLQERTTRT